MHNSSKKFLIPSHQKSTLRNLKVLDLRFNTGLFFTNFDQRILNTVTILGWTDRQRNRKLDAIQSYYETLDKDPALFRDTEGKKSLKRRFINLDENPLHIFSPTPGQAALADQLFSNI